MFWRKSETMPVAEPVLAPSIASQSATEFDRALDTLGAILRVYGEYAFDTDRATASDIKESCSELWRDLSLGPSKSSDPEAIARVSRRDYSKVSRFFDSQRRQEQEFVIRGIGNLRQTVQEFAQCLTAAVAEDRQADSQIEGQLIRLADVVTGNDMNAVRQEATKVLSLVRNAIDRRRHREKEQLVHLGAQVQALRSELDAVRTQATLDALTQLFNRAAFDQEIDKVATLGLLLGSDPCLVMVDVDNFKSINDKHGHPIGDEVLRAVADNLVRHFLRKEDFVCRFGGEEFAIVIRDSAVEKVNARIERARSTLASTPVRTAAGPIDVTFSAGLTGLVPGEAPSQWVERADRALYAAKHQGRNRVIVFPASASDMSAAP
jgi:diguanylate cyclase (GGDEF)-like protein